MNRFKQKVGEPAETQAIVAAVHTDAVIAAYVAFQAEQESELA